jgi:tetratricopeptide (TPR) repeat protein
LAMGKIAIAEAHALADEAVGQAEREAAEVSLKDADGRGFGQMERLSHYWVTLGLVYFREGRLDKAEVYMRASWELDPRGHVGNHLGRVYEAEHRDGDAIAVYRQALGARGSEGLKQSVRERLGNLGVANAEAQPSLAAVPVPGLGLTEPAVFDVLLRQGAVPEVMLVKGDDQAAAGALAGAIGDALKSAEGLHLVLPDSGPERVLRRGRVSCGEDGACSVQMLTPQAARAAGV